MEKNTKNCKLKAHTQVEPAKPKLLIEKDIFALLEHVSGASGV